MFNIVLVEPEIPQNAGNIARTCAATGTRLHMVRPLGFEVTDKYLKRAGLDYWHLVDISYYDNFSQLRKNSPRRDFSISRPRDAAATATYLLKTGIFSFSARKPRACRRTFAAAPRRMSAHSHVF